MGPLLLFDKSLLHVLVPSEIEELSHSFILVGSPTLTGEILADLKKARPENKIPEEMVQALARKIGRTSPVQPASFRKLALHNLDCVKVPMKGQVPIDGDAPNVAVVDGGSGMLYDQTPEQEIWRRWADGDFIIQDHDTATMWRCGIERVNLKAVGDSWKEYVNEHFGAAKTIPELVEAIDQHLATQKIERQRYLFMTLIDFLRAPEAQRSLCVTFLKHGCLLQSISPYAASVLRLYLTFVASIAKGFVGPRASHYIDLQYLFYAPFCMVFASDDNLHKKLWAATRGKNTMITAVALKQDLARRIELRKSGVQTFQRGYPIPLDDSVITASMDHAFGSGWLRRISRDDDSDGLKPGTLVEDLPPVDRDRIKNAFRIFDQMSASENDLS